MKRYLGTIFLVLLLFPSLLFANSTTLYGSDSCFECAKVKEYLASQQIEYTYFDISDSTNFKYYKNVLKQYELVGSPSPLLIKDGNAYAGYENITSSTPELPAAPPSLLLIFLAGMVDGINPCALSLLLFILSLCISQKLKLFKSLSLYVLGILGTNYLMGFMLVLGYSQLTQYAKYIYLGIILLSVGLLILNLLSFWDFSIFFNKLREFLSNRPFYIVIFISSVLVAMLEFFCTSQVYLPSTLYIATSKNWGALLLLYNIGFIIPMLLLILFGFLIRKKSPVSLNRYISIYQKPITILNNVVLAIIIIILIFQYGRLY